MSVAKGRIAEAKGVSYLQKLGFIVIDRNFYTRFGELDIVATKNNVIHIIEVKSGVNFEPILNITPLKIAKLERTIEIFMAKKSLDLDYQLDALIIKGEEIELFENITL